MDFLNRATASDHSGEAIPEEPEYLCRYSVVKHSWRGRYKRLLCVAPTALITLDPLTLHCTNCYDLASDFESVSVASGKEEPQALEFTLNVRADGRGKFKPIKFSTRHRTALLTELYRVLSVLHGAPRPPAAVEYSALHLRRRFGTFTPCTLRVTGVGVESVEPATGKLLWVLDFRDMDSPGIVRLQDPPGSTEGTGEAGGFVLCPLYGRKRKAFTAGAGTTNSAILSKIVFMAKTHLGFSVVVDTLQKMDLKQFVQQMAGAGLGGAEAPVGEWSVVRHRTAGRGTAPGPPLPVAMGALQQLGEGSSSISRQLVLTRTCFVERRPDSYEAAVARPLSAVAALVRFGEEPQMFALEFNDGCPAFTYTCPERDAVLSAMRDMIQWEGQRPLPVVPRLTMPGHRLDPPSAQLAPPQGPGMASRLLADPEGDSLCVKLLAAAARDAVAEGGSIPGSKAKLWRRVRELNACVPYCGLLPAAEVPDVALMALLSMLPAPPPGAPDAPPPPSPSPKASATYMGLLACLRRLLAAQGAAALVVGMPGAVARLLGLLRSGSEGVTAEAAGLLAMLIGGGPGSERLPAPAGVPAGERRAAAARAKAATLGQSRGQLAALVRRLEPRAVSPLLAAAVVEVLEALLVEPHSDTTGDSTFYQALQQVALLGRRLFALLAHPAEGTREAVSVLMRIVAEEDPAAAAPMRDAALRDGALLRHLLAALFLPAGEPRDVSRQLVALWADAHPPALDLLSRCLPPGLVAFQHSPLPEAPPPRAPIDSVVSQAVPEETPQPGGHAQLLSGSLASTHQALTAAQRHIRRILQPRQGRVPRGVFGPADFLTQAPHPTPALSFGPSAVSGKAVPSKSKSGTDAPLRGGANSAEGGGGGAGSSRPRGASPSRARPGASASSGGAADAALAGHGGREEAAGHAATAGPQDGAAEVSGGEQPVQAPGMDSSAAGARPQGSSRSDSQGSLGSAPLSASETPGRSALGPASGSGLAFDSAVESAAPAADLVADGHVEGAQGGQGPALNPGKLSLNWPEFWRQFGADHHRADLIWNERTRQELREALEAEGRHLEVERERSAGGGAGEGPLSQPSWNFAEFSVRYPSLSKELCVGGYYLRLFLEKEWQTVSIRDPSSFFRTLYHRFSYEADVGLAVEGADWEEMPGSDVWCSFAGLDGFGGGAGAGPVRELCARAMALVYEQYGAAIGPFEGTAHMTVLLDRTADRTLRHRLLILLKAAVKVPANAKACVAVGGCQLAVDLLTTAHEAAERTSIPLQSNLIAASAHLEPPKEWFYMAPDGAPVGPLQRDVLRRAWSQGHVTLATRCWAAGMPEWRCLRDIRELRWAVAAGLPILAPAQVAECALALLHSLLAIYSDTGDAGELVVPTPRVKGILCSPRCLPHIAQSLLSGEPRVVAGAASLLQAIVVSNPKALARLYATGAFYFALAYGGSNLQAVADLFAATHTRQAFHGGAEAALAKRSVLGGILPESLLYVLDRHGPEEFAAAMVADSDTPEIIWTHDMRGRHLIGQVLQHLGDFPQRLTQHAHAVYDYAPMPPVSYPELSNEMWCHRYYLRNLCDEIRFPDWPIAEPVEFLQSLLAMWREELTRRPMDLSEEEACAILEMPLEERQGLPGAGADGEGKGDGKVVLDEELVKRQYRKLAMRFHPDKNPEGRDRFLALQKAFETLQASLLGLQGPQRWRLLLLLRGQCILFRRCGALLAPFKYAGFPMLLEALRVDADDTNYLAPDRAPLLEAATELCYLTCESSPLNGEELGRDGGLPLLGALLGRCMYVVQPGTPPTEPAAVIVTNVMRTLGALSGSESVRSQVLACPGMVADVVNCVGLESAAAAVEAGLKAIRQLAASPELQDRLLSAGAIWLLLPLLLQFDSTAEGEGKGPLHKGDEPQRVGQSIQSSRNKHAVLAVEALGQLAGPPRDGEASPANEEATAVLGALLTPKLAAMLVEGPPLELLPCLTANLETPQIIWSSGMRRELLRFVEAQREAGMADGAFDLTAAKGFTYQALAQEEQVGGVYLRVYNQQPQFELSHPERFCSSLVDYIAAELAGRGRRDDCDETGLSLGSAMRVAESGHDLDAVAGSDLDRFSGLLEAGEAEGVSGAAAAVLPAAESSRGFRIPKHWEEEEEEEEAAGRRRRGEEGEEEEEWGGVLEPSTSGRSFEDVFEDGEEGFGEFEEVGRTAVEAGRRGEGGGEGPLVRALTALQNVVAAYPGVASLLAARARLAPLFGCIRACRAAETDGAAAELALGILLRLTQHAPCVAALLAEPRELLFLLQRLHGAPRQRQALLQLLGALAGSAELAWAVAQQGGLMYLLELLLAGAEDVHGQQRAAAAASASLLGKLMAQPVHGPRVALALSRFLPDGLLAAIRDGPGEAVVAALGRTSETPELVWSPAMAASLAARLARLAEEQTRGAAGEGEGEGEGEGRPESPLPEEPRVGGVYLRLFLKDPQFPLRNPKRFLEGLLEEYVAASTAGGGGGRSPAAGERPLLLAAALVALLRAQPALAAQVAHLGYVPKLVSAMASEGGRPAMSAGEEGGGGGPSPSPSPWEQLRLSCLRLLHQLAASAPCAEAMATPGLGSHQIVALLMKAIGWAGGGVLALETLQRCLAAGNRARDGLVAQGLRVGLVPVLLGILDWRSCSSSSRGLSAQMKWSEEEASVGRVLAVEVLRGLAADGAYAAKVRETLGASEVWRAYKDQKHDLFLPSSAQAAVAGVAGLIEGHAAASGLPLLAPPIPTMGLGSSEAAAPPPPLPPAGSEQQRAAGEPRREAARDSLLPRDALRARQGTDRQGEGTSGYIPKVGFGRIPNAVPGDGRGGYGKAGGGKSPPVGRGS